MLWAGSQTWTSWLFVTNFRECESLQFLFERPMIISLVEFCFCFYQMTFHQGCHSAFEIYFVIKVIIFSKAFTQFSSLYPTFSIFKILMFFYTTLKIFKTFQIYNWSINFWSLKILNPIALFVWNMHQIYPFFVIAVFRNSMIWVQSQIINQKVLRGLKP